MTEATHDELWNVCETLPEDYHPYGNTVREGSDCSCGCKFFHVLEGLRGMDWGVCFNSRSHRSGLLTFEHQGCTEFVYDESQDDDLLTDYSNDE